MNPQFIIYAKQLGVIGRKIRGVSDIKTAKPENYAEAAAFAANYGASIVNIQTVIHEMQEVNPPKDVKSEHLKLIGELKTFLNGMKMATDSIDSTGKTYNEEMYLNGLSLMESGKNDAVNTATDIGNLLKKKLLF